jgi:hypothetical protein
LFSFCDNAESDRCGAAPSLPNEPKPPDDLAGCDDWSGAGAGASADDERRLNVPKPPPDFDGDESDFDDENEDEDDDRCDENPLLKLDDLDGLASAASTCVSGTSRDRMKAT